MACKQKQSSCAKMVDAKGKPSGLMMAGSAYHMESVGQEKKNLIQDMPIDSKASAVEMSPFKEEDPNKEGVTVSGKDKRKSAEQARKERMDKAKKEREDAAMKKKIAKANKIEEIKFKQEEKKAAYAAKMQRAKTKKDKLTGRVDKNAEDTSTKY